jgi:RNA polymerase sigma-70 factor (ECF subfamily)
MSEARDHRDTLHLILRAQRGDTDSASRVAALATDKVFAYLYRIGLDYHLAEDLCQETMVRFTEYLPKLKIKDEHALWAWLYRTAYSRFQQHGRDATRKKRGGSTVIHSDLVNSVASDTHGAFNTVAHKELTQTVWKAMGTLKPRYRQVLTLRCFDQLSYAQIAAVTGGSRIQAKVLFFRAKQSLKGQLVRHGLTRSHLLSALGVFAAATAGPGKQATAAASVTATSTQVGLGTVLIGTVATKLGTAVTATALAGTIAVCTVVPAILPQHTIHRTPGGLPQEIYKRLHDRVRSSASRFDLLNVATVYDANTVMTASYGSRRYLDAALPLLGANPVTATLCLCMVRDGVIRGLDDPIRQYSDRFADCMPARYKDTDLTFRHLLAHTSGLPEGSSYAMRPIWQAGTLNLDAAPGTQFRMSAAGFAVLETLLEDLSGRTFDELLDQYIAAPIEADSFKAIRPQDPNVAGVLCSVTDLARFFAHFLQGRYIPGDLIRQEVWHPQIMDYYGLGWSIMRRPDSPLPIIVSGHHAWDIYEVYYNLQPCGRLAAILMIQKKSPRQSMPNMMQMCLDLIGIMGDQHKLDMGGPHEEQWMIP